MKYLRDESGQMLIMTAVSMIALMGFLAFATDVGVLFYQRRTAQTVADSAALAGASDLKLGIPGADLQTAVQAEIAQNYNSSWANAVTVNYPPLAGPHANVNGYVEVIVAQPNATSFMNTFMHIFRSGSGASSYNSVTVAARAVATDQIKATPCIIVPNPTGVTTAVDLGGNSLVTGTDCGVVVNGSMDLTGSSELNAPTVSASGTIAGINNITGTAVQGGPPVSDPLAYLSEAGAGGVPGPGGNEPYLNPSNPLQCISPDGSQCFLNQTLTGTQQSPLAPGVYMFTQTPTFGPSAWGTGVVIYLANSMPFAMGNGTLNLTAPTSGLYNGILIDAPNDTATDTSCTKGNGPSNSGAAGTLDMNFGSSSTTLNGIVYAPNAHLFLQDQGSGTTTVDTDLVVGTICDQSANITVGGYSGGNSPITQIGLTE